MAITFNNIPDTTRVPGAYIEIDNSRALKGLYANPHKALIVAQRGRDTSGNFLGSKPSETLIAITNDVVSEGFFGAGTIMDRMCKTFKANNPNTELWAIQLSDTACTGAASGALRVSLALSANGNSCGGAGTYYLMINGTAVNVPLTSGWSTTDVNSAIQTAVNADSTLPVRASTNATSAVTLIAVCSGSNGDYINFRDNYYTYQSLPAAMSGDSVLVSVMEGGVGAPDLGDAWTIIDNEQYHYIIQPYTDATNLTEVEDELTDRFDPLVDKMGHGFTCMRGTQASLTTLGNTRNNQFNVIIGAYDSPTGPEEWAAALGAVAAKNLNNDPARPLHFLKLKNVLPPPVENRFTRAEREILLYDGIATFVVDASDNVLVERCITTYQTNSAGVVDYSYLDIQTGATLSEIRHQLKARIVNRFLSPRYKLADDTFPVQPGSYVVTPSVIKQEIITLFSQLRDKGLIENLDDFIDNLVVERDATDANRVNALLPPDLINQFRVFAGLIQFIL